MLLWLHLPMSCPPIAPHKCQQSPLRFALGRMQQGQRVQRAPAHSAQYSLARHPQDGAVAQVQQMPQA